MKTQALIPLGQEIGSAALSLWQGDGPGVGDFIDLINPLQHLPVISTIYREITGDQMSAAANMVGGALFGGIPGLIGSVANVAFEAGTGKDIGSTAIDALESLGNSHGENVTPYTPMGAAPLTADQGQGLLSIIQATQSMEDPSARQSAIPETSDADEIKHLSDLYQIQGFSLGMSDNRKREQLLAGLTKIAGDMKVTAR